MQNMLNENLIVVDCVYYKFKMTPAQLARDYGMSVEELEAGIAQTRCSHAIYNPRITPCRVDDDIDWIEWRAMTCLGRQLKRTRSSFDFIAMWANAIADSLFHRPTVIV